LTCQNLLITIRPKRAHFTQNNGKHWQTTGQHKSCIYKMFIV